MVKSEKAKDQNTYHVTLGKVPEWKINSIAQYKRKKYLALQKKNEESNLTNNLTKENPDSNMILVRAAANEMIKLKKAEAELKQECNTFNTTKTTMLWLLQKSTSYERYQNHTLS